MNTSALDRSGKSTSPHKITIFAPFPTTRIAFFRRFHVEQVRSVTIVNAYLVGYEIVRSVYCQIVNFYFFG